MQLKANQLSNKIYWDKTVSKVEKIRNGVQVRLTEKIGRDQFLQHCGLWSKLSRQFVVEDAEGRTQERNALRSPHTLIYKISKTSTKKCPQSADWLYTFLAILCSKFMRMFHLQN
jgi:hypothetical protein